MQPTFSSSRILQPVRPWFIFFSLIMAALLNFLPTAQWVGMPDWVALVLCFWSVREFRRVGMGWAFQVMPLLLATQVVQVLMRMAVGAEFPGWDFFIGPFIATLLWIPATFILLLPQYRPEEQDPDRPI